jgi:hypothetical protein
MPSPVIAARNFASFLALVPLLIALVAIPTTFLRLQADAAPRTETDRTK